MPERQIPWRQVAGRLAGTFRAYTRRPSYASEATREFYDYQLKGRTVSSCSHNFEEDPERFIAAIEAAVTLAHRPAALFKEWQE